MKSLLLVDIRNIYQQVSRQKPGYVVTYNEYIKFLEESLGIKFVQKLMFLSQTFDQARTFVNFLRTNQYTVFCGDREWSPVMALEVADRISAFDSIIIMSNRYPLLDIAAFCKTKNKLVTIVSNNVPPDFKQYADIIGLNFDFIKKKPTHETAEAAESVGVRADESSNAAEAVGTK